jgi:rieske iron-sulfur protein
LPGNVNNDGRSEAIRCACLNRRVVLGGIAGSAIVGVSGARAQGDPATLSPQIGDYFVRATGEDKSPITPESIEIGAAPFSAWPVDAATDTVRDGTLYNLVNLSRWEPTDLTADAQAFAADGVVCQTVICTHASCEVSDWIADARVIECPCHFSRFDPKANGAVTQGPAFRKLPALQLALADGRVVVNSAFDGRVGGDVDE